MNKYDIENFLSNHSHFKPDDFDAGGLRNIGDFSSVGLMLRKKGSNLFCHDDSLFDEVILEIHNEIDNNGNPLKKPLMQYFALSSKARFELAMYLLSTINVR